MKTIYRLIVAVLFSLAIFTLGACGQTREKMIDENNTETELENETSTKKTATQKSAVFSYDVEGDEITITGLKEGGEELVVPETINGLAVTKIADYAFQDKTFVKSAEFPKSIKSFGYAMFGGCSSLCSLTLPFTGDKNTTEKGLKQYPFGYIFGEDKYNGGNAVTQYYFYDTLDRVESSVYYLPSTLKEVTITGKENTRIPYSTFYNCSSLAKITLGSDITGVGEFAFSGCVAEIAWDNPTLKKIDEFSFADYKGSELTIPNGVKTIERDAYCDCINVKSFTVPNSVTDIDLYAFRGCFSLESIDLGSNVKKIGINAFYFCQKLKNVNLNDGLEEIEESAFTSCKSLETITIPKSVKMIRKNAFKDCEKLKNVYFKDAKGWRYYNSMTSGETVKTETMSNPVSAAELISKSRLDYIWERR